MDGFSDALRSFLLLGIDFFRLLLFVWVVLSWFPDTHTHPWYMKLNRLFSDILAPIRRVIPPIGGMVDISPIVLFFLLHLLAMLVSAVL